MSEFPKWIVPHESHPREEIEKAHQVHMDRVAPYTVLVKDEEEEAKLLSEYVKPDHKEEA